MESILFIARLLLAGVFVLAGLAKLADRPGARRAITEFGLPAALAAPLAVALPLLELAIGLALLADASAAASAIAALVLLLLFAIGIAINLGRGRTPDCHCFGQVHSTPVSARTLMRNAVLAGLAVLIAWHGPGDATDAVGWIGDLRAGEAVVVAALVLLLAAAALQGWLLLNLFRQNGRMLRRVDALDAALGTATASALEERAGLPVGTRAPDFTLPSSSGMPVSLSSILAIGKPVVLLFTDPACAPCVELAPEIGHWQRKYGAGLTLTVISRRDDGQEVGWAANHGVGRVLLQDGTEILEAYEAVGTPSAVVVTPEGTLASRAAFGVDSIRSLVEDCAEQSMNRVMVDHVRA